MSSASPRSSGSPSALEVEEPRKKGARGGKRSVTHLSKAQLARKRANDREAQRNIRQRTKEHIETLEKRVKELEGGARSSSMERALKRNSELEEEVERLRTQVARQSDLTGVRVSPDISEEMAMPRPAEGRWIPDSESQSPSCPWPAASLPSRTVAMTSNEAPVLNTSFPMDDSVYGPTPRHFDSPEDSQQLYTPTITPIWDDQMVFRQNGQTPNYIEPLPAPAWAPFHPTLSQPSRFADLQSTGFQEVINTPSYANTTCWQSQPSIYAWQISTKLKVPATYVDQLMFSVIHSQRHLQMTSDLTSEDVIGSSDFPSVHVLFDQPGPATSKPPSSLGEVMACYSACLSNRGFALIPEKLASFMCMYRFVQWQISPTYTTLQALHDWQAPRPAQLTIAHPAWMDLPPWPKFREKIIENQARYDNIEFQNDYATNLSVNFPYDPMKALVFEDGQMKVSKLMERWLSDLAHMSMKKGFVDKYPEFKDVCRFDEA